MINRYFKAGDEIIVVNLDKHWGSRNWLIHINPDCKIGDQYIVTETKAGDPNLGAGYSIPKENFLLKSDYDRLKKEYDDQLSTGMFSVWHPELTGEWERDIDKWIELAEKDERENEECHNSVIECSDRVEEMAKDVKQEDLGLSSFEEKIQELSDKYPGEYSNAFIGMDAISREKDTVSSGPLGAEGEQTPVSPTPANKTNDDDEFVKKINKHMYDMALKSASCANKNTFRHFESGSIRDDDSTKPLVNHLDPYTRLRYGYHMRLGANKYNKGNWRHGQPTETAIESINRHLAMYELGDRSEDHLSALIFNVQLIMMNEQKSGVEVDHYFNKGLV